MSAQPAPRLFAWAHSRSQAPERQPDVLLRRAPRVVIDNTLVVGALVFGGGPSARLRSAWQTQRVRPIMSLATLYDLHCRLADPRLALSSDERQRLLNDYLPHTLRADVSGRVERPSPEPLPLAMLRLAQATRAHAIVSAEPELLSLRGASLPCAVLSLDAFLDQVPEARQRRRPA